MHNDIKAFHLAGYLNDKNVDHTKDELLHALKDYMLLEGYVEVLDIDPQFSVDYDESKDRFNYQLTLYGIEGDSTCAGYMGGKKIMKYIPPDKSE